MGSSADETRLHALLLDPLVDPRKVERDGWAVVRAMRLPVDGTPEALAEWLERDAFALDLLTQTQLTDLTVEQRLTPLRRWLLLSGRTADFPLTAAALIAQAGHNGGVWLFDGDEATALASNPAFAPAYGTLPAPASAAGHASPVTAAVAGQYAAWPYPVWQRAMTVPGEELDTIRAQFGLPPLPPGADLLVAGCGTGREAIRLARNAPAARVTAIDLSPASLAYAEARNTAPNLRFLQHDLHDVAALGLSFDHIASSGVLHHLPDPEAGWAALAATLRPGGTMRVMLYSRIARMQVEAAHAAIADLRAQPVTADLIRAVRARFMTDPPHPITGAVDFYSMGGVHDLLLHTHEDPFDFPRIARALDAIGLEPLTVRFPNREARDAYRAVHPHDPRNTDLAALHAWERRHPRLFSGMINLWCVRPG